MSHQFGKRDLIFAHLCDYFSEDNFRLALSGDVQLVLKRFTLREQFFKGGHFHLHYKKSFYEVVWVFDNVLINKGVGAEKIAFNSGSGLRERVSASRLPWLTDQACGTDGCRISGIPVCDCVGVFSRRDPANDNMPYRPTIKRCCLHAELLTGLFTETAVVYAHHAGSARAQPSCGSIGIQIPRLPN
jgi:hypothetical protein